MNNILYKIIGVFIFSFFIFKVLFIALNVKIGLPPDEIFHLEFIQKYYQSDDLILQPSEKATLIGFLSQSRFLYHLIMGKLFMPIYYVLNLDLDWRVFLRIANILFCVLNIFVFYKIVELIFDSVWQKLSGLILYTNLLMFTFISASVNYDNLLNLISILVLYYCIKISRTLNIEAIFLTVSLILLGLLVKPPTLILHIPLIVLAILSHFKRENLKKLFTKIKGKFSQKPYSKGVLTFSIFIIVTVSSVYLRNLYHYSSLIPNCQDVYSEEDCFSDVEQIIVGNTLTRNAEHMPKKLPFTYFDDWVNVIYNKSFGIFGHQSMSLSYLETDLVRSLIAILFIIIFFTGFQPVLRNENGFIILHCFLFILGAFVHNYISYLAIGIIGPAIHGRYLFPVLPGIIISVIAIINCIKVKYIQNSVLFYFCLVFIYLDFFNFYFDANRPLFE